MSGAFARVVLLAAALAAGGCAAPVVVSPPPPPPQPPPRPLNLQGFPAAFKEGYTDGCDSARLRSSRRDEGRYRTDFDYAQGWNDGHFICARRK